MSECRREGDLYKVFKIREKIFFVYYGYYDDIDRSGIYNEPIPIFPDFITSPVYTDEGYPFVTAIQDTCERFEGEHSDDGCHGCKHYETGEELIGICRCPENKK